MNILVNEILLSIFKILKTHPPLKLWINIITPSSIRILECYCTVIVIAIVIGIIVFHWYFVTGIIV